MARFAFIIHPLSKRDVARKYKIAKYLPESAVEAVMGRKKPFVISEITGIESPTGATTSGLFIALPLTPRQMIQTMPMRQVYDKIVRCAEIGKEHGADLIGLGAFTSVVGDGGITVAKEAPIGVTTGNSYTVATAIQGTINACKRLDIDLGTATLAVVGATGSIGKTCAQVLARDFGRTILVGRDQLRTQALTEGIQNSEATTNVEAIKEADAIITVSSAGKELVFPEHLKPGAIVCDVARPRDVSVRVAKERPDVLVIEGGVVKVPGDVEFNFSFGFPEKTAYACMSETMILALENDPSLFNFTLGKEVSVEQVDEINALADKHGFKLAGFRSFEHAVSEEAVIRAKNARLTSTTVARGT